MHRTSLKFTACTEHFTKMGTSALFWADVLQSVIVAPAYVYTDRNVVARGALRTLPQRASCSCVFLSISLSLILSPSLSFYCSPSLSLSLCCILSIADDTRRVRAIASQIASPARGSTASDARGGENAPSISLIRDKMHFRPLLLRCLSPDTLPFSCPDPSFYSG